VKNWFDEHAVRVRYDTEAFICDGHFITASQLLSRLVLDSVKHGAGINQRHIEHAFNLWIPGQRKAIVEEHRAKIAFESTVGDGEARRFLQALSGAQDPVNLAALLHFIWQVKRKLAELPVEHHMMLVLVGPQGGGKTEAIRHLLSPIRELTQTVSELTLLSDSREYSLLERAYVVFFDEMARAARTDVSAIKAKITNPTVSYRVLSTHLRNVGLNVSTFISAANQEVQDLIVDPSGMRRFFQLKVLPRADWKEVNTIDYVALWRGVDPDAPSPIVPVLEQVRALQSAELRAPSLVERFLAERCDVGGGKGIKVADLHAAYEEFARLRRLSMTLTRESFGRQVSALMEQEAAKLQVAKTDLVWKSSGTTMYRVTVQPDPLAANH
jgi:hypothetical protein